MKQQITENIENLVFGNKIARVSVVKKIAWESVVTLKRRPPKIIHV